MYFEIRIQRDEQEAAEFIERDNLLGYIFLVHPFQTWFHRIQGFDIETASVDLCGQFSTEASLRFPPRLLQSYAPGA